MTRTHRDAPLTGSDFSQEFFLPRQWLLAQDISDKFDRITAIQRNEIVKLFPVSLCLLRRAMLKALLSPDESIIVAISSRFLS